MRRKPRPPSRCRCPRFRPFPDSEGWAVPRRRACQRVESDCRRRDPMPGPMLDPATPAPHWLSQGSRPPWSDMPDDSQPDGPQPDGPQPDDSQADDTQKGADKADAHAGDEGTEQVPAGQTVVLPTGGDHRSEAGTCESHLGGDDRDADRGSLPAPGDHAPGAGQRRAEPV